MQLWADIEGQLPSFHTLKQRMKFVFHLRLIAFGLLALALSNVVFESIVFQLQIVHLHFFTILKYLKIPFISVEITLDHASFVHFYWKCEQRKNPLLEYVNENVPYLYTNANHISVFEAIIPYVIAIYPVFVWNYLDIFLVSIGIGLTSLFKLFNNELRQLKGKVCILCSIYTAVYSCLF